MWRIFRASRNSLSLIKTLLVDYGFVSSVLRGEIKKDGEYLPWYTFPAIEALKAWDFSDKKVLEYGAGYSTLFWAKRSVSVISIEDNPEWYERINCIAPENVRLELRPLEEYAKSPDGRFDIIVVDGYARSRMRYYCAQESLPHLNDGGMVIVDNSDWLPATCWYLRESGLTQIDFSGFVNGNPHTQTTSFFLTRDFNFRHAQRVTPVGGTGYNWEKTLEQELLKLANTERAEPNKTKTLQSQGW